MIKVAIADDHQLVAKAISGLIQKIDPYDVIFEVENGKELVRYFNLGMVPDIVLLDINMPEMDGYETALWLKTNYPDVKVLALSMYDKEESIVTMLRNGAKGYLLKGCRPSELKDALDAIMTKGFYYTEYLTDRLVKSLNSEKSKNPAEQLGLNSRELQFIEYACSELTYNEIADLMCVSPRTVDGYREQVFMKLGVKSRVGVVLEAIKSGIIKI
ncbi:MULTISPECIES: response regulator transcription factor [Emticicia]|uniref:response regulator transcription factor n=1 Tax=Emticicia TaxID=312278 RepID=UPI000C78C79B|nr:MULTISPECIES: response regulator transcription factor [Emticicia]PLK43205.1 DNA-binding response regulator [Emticicia sp. TH156]UTA69241.1 response regulator transcription factor [Emticicia sp. 21SJ11W-3]